MDFNCFQHLLSMTNDCSSLLHQLELGHLKLSKNLEKSNFEKVRNEIISNLCAKIETFLRLEVHSHLQLEKMNPFEQSINDYRDLIGACPLLLGGSYVVLKGGFLLKKSESDFLYFSIQF